MPARARRTALKRAHLAPRAPRRAFPARSTPSPAPLAYLPCPSTLRTTFPPSDSPSGSRDRAASLLFSSTSSRRRQLHQDVAALRRSPLLPEQHSNEEDISEASRERRAAFTCDAARVIRWPGEPGCAREWSFEHPLSLRSPGACRGDALFEAYSPSAARVGQRVRAAGPGASPRSAIWAAVV